MGSYPSSGLKKGVVVNIDATTDAIQKSIDQARHHLKEKLRMYMLGLQEIIFAV
jgi:cell division protein FtsA